MKTANTNTPNYKVVTEDSNGNQIIINLQPFVELVQEHGKDVHMFIEDLDKAKDCLVADLNTINMEINQDIYFGVNVIYKAMKHITIQIEKGGDND